MTGFRLQRLGQVMEPEPGNPLEAEGVLNPAAARGPDGELYLFQRLVAAGNCSRIGTCWYCDHRAVVRSAFCSDRCGNSTGVVDTMRARPIKSGGRHR